MNSATRRKYILDKLNTERSISIKDICNELTVSLPTIRNDLDILERNGDIIRTFGGAILNEQKPRNDSPQSVSYSTRIAHNLESKIKIGKYAASLVNPFDSLFLDAGTTVYQILDDIKDIDHLVVLTNSINVCTYLMEIPRIVHYLMGGSVKPSSMATVGIKTIEDIRRNKVNKVFLGADGMSADAFTVQDVNEAMTKLAMMEIAAKKYLMVDSSKFNNATFVEVAKFDMLDAIITEKGIRYIKPQKDENARLSDIVIDT